jgi:electron-transferring-flavoprotein dehydrogenase
MGGGWLYGMNHNLLSLGYCTWLSYADPATDPHRNFQAFKTHPFIKKILEGGKMVQYGAKAVSVGGLYSIPKMVGEGFLMVGESANLVDGQKLKGVHLAIGGGHLAGDALLHAFKRRDFSEKGLEGYSKSFYESDMAKELQLSRNFHQAFDKCMVGGFVRTGIQMALKGRDLLGTRLQSTWDRSHMKKIDEYYGAAGIPAPTLKFDNHTLFDKVTDVYHSGSLHEEDQPSHLQVPDLNLCATRCVQEYGNPCTKFCPAAVYEMEEKDSKTALKINASNCVHCKTCDIMDPYLNIRWVTPEGGGGPAYTIL